jgi:hypothetical protein
MAVLLVRNIRFSGLKDGPEETVNKSFGLLLE